MNLKSICLKSLTFVLSSAITVTALDLINAGSLNEINYQVANNMRVEAATFDREDERAERILEENRIPEVNNKIINEYTYVLDESTLDMKPEIEFIYDGTILWVKAETINVKSEPDEDSEGTCEVKKGDRITRISFSEDWSYIRDASGNKGYVLSDYLSPEEIVVATPTPSPKPTKAPTATPKPTKKPEATSTPKPTKKPEATATPKPTKKPEATATPKPTKAITATPTPTPTEEIKPTETTETTETTSEETTAKPTATPKPTSKPSSSDVTEKEYKVKLYTTTSVNVRKGPGTNYEIAYLASEGKEIKAVAKTSNDWIKLEDGNYILSKYTTKEAPSTGNTGDKSSFVSFVKSFQGVKYVYAAASPSAFDCSGLVMYCFKEYYGISLPHSANAMKGYGKEVSPENIKAGDCVLFDYEHDGRVDHIGIYVGNNTVIHASQTKGKVVASTYSAMIGIDCIRRYK